MVSRLVFPEVLRYNTIGFTLYDMVRMTGQGHGLHPSPRNPAWVQTVRKWRELRWAVIQLECGTTLTLGVLWGCPLIQKVSLLLWVCLRRQVSDGGGRQSRPSRLVLPVTRGAETSRGC